MPEAQPWVFTRKVAKTFFFQFLQLSCSGQEIVADPSPERDHDRHDRASQKVSDASAGSTRKDRGNSARQLRQPGDDRTVGFERIRWVRRRM